MANDILAVSPHSSNPVSHIAYLIGTALQERCDLFTEPHTDYQQQLATLMGLGFTAILAEGSRIRSCRPYFTTFLRYRDFIQHADKFERLSHAIAEMICNAVYPFKVLGYPRYYDDFVAALVNTLKSYDTHDTEVEKGIKKIMQELFEQCS